jgi:glucose/arabinose dehydrogenase
VQGAWLAGIPLPVGPLAESDRVRRALAGDFELRLAATAGHATDGLGALLWLTNQRGHEALLVGVQGSDLILRWPGPGTRHGLPAAPLRLAGFFEPSPPGAGFELRIQRRGAETRVARDAAQAEVLGPWLGDGWRLLAPELRLSPAARSLLAAAWLGGLWLPLGFWFAPSAGPIAALAAAAAAMLLAPRVGSLLPTPGWQLAAAAIGFALGLLLQRRARPVALLTAALLLAVGCRESEPETVEPFPSPELSVCPDATPREALALETLASGLEVPWDLGFAPDGRIFVTERPGRIRVIENGRLREQPWAQLDVFAAHEAGLMGVAVDPDFATNRYVYVVGTFLAAPAEGLAWLADRLLRRALALISPSAGSIYASRVMRLEDRDGSGVDPQLIIDELPAEPLHAGGALDFAPDGSLFVTTGESQRGSLAQDPDALEGKLLRYQRDGRVPEDAAVAGSPVFARGFRNPQALAWDSERGALFAVEHGPSGLPSDLGRGGNDELNAIEAGGNYGWPQVAGMGRGAGLTWPIASWSPAIAPAGIAVYRGDALPWNGSILIGGLRGSALRRLELEPAPGQQPAWRVRCQETLFSGELGRIRAVVVGPDARVYLTTSNRDGRGGPAPAGDDRVLRLSGGGAPPG